MKSSSRSRNSEIQLFPSAEAKRLYMHTFLAFDIPLKSRKWEKESCWLVLFNSWFHLMQVIKMVASLCESHGGGGGAIQKKEKREKRKTEQGVANN